MNQQSDGLIIIKRDGQEVHRAVNWTDAYRYLHSHQPQSVHYALRYGGYSIVEVCQCQSGRTCAAEGFCVGAVR